MRSIEFNFREEGDCVALTSSGVLRLDKREFRLLTRLTSAAAEERLRVFQEEVADKAGGTDFCPVCQHPNATLIDQALREGKNPRDTIPGALPTAAEQQRHVAEDHDVSRPPGWWLSVEEALHERGVLLRNQRTWSRLKKVDGCPVCSSPLRVEIEAALGHTALVSLWGKYGIDRGELRAHRRHM